MYPKPVQKPRPPILIGGYVDAVLKRAATKGDGWLTYFYTPESFTQVVGQDPRLRPRGRAAIPTTLTATNQLAIHVGSPAPETEAPMRQWLQTEWDLAAWSESTIEQRHQGHRQGVRRAAPQRTSPRASIASSWAAVPTGRFWR